MVRRRIGWAALASVAAVAVAVSAAQALAQSSATPRCTTGALEVWIGNGQGTAAAGSNYYPLELTNVSGQTCHLFGFPGVSASAGGHRLGSPAGRDGTATQTVTLAPGASSHSLLQIVNVGNFSPSACQPAAADSLTVYPPNATRAASVPFQFQACSATGPVFMFVRPVQPRVGIPGH